MGRRNPQFDAYIARAQPFARPILEHLRAVVHQAVPEVAEEFKWSHPSFTYKGLLCGMAAFREHATFGFWKHSLVVTDPRAKWDQAMGSFGRLTSVKDLPPKGTLVKYLKKAKQLNDDGVAAPHMTNRKKRPALPVPGDLKGAIARDPSARVAWEEFSPSAQRDYVEWIIEAKTADPRAKRMATALEWIAQGKRRNWKYER